MTHSHVPCKECGRLLVPVSGQIPRHKRPERIRYSKNGGAKAAPLTGPDAEWCKGGDAFVMA